MDERLSTRWTPAIRWASTLILGGLAILFALSALRGERTFGEAAVFIVFLFFVNWRAWLWQLKLWDVWLSQDGIRIRRGSTEENIPIRQIELVAYTHWFGFGEIVLEPATKGRRILVFVPRMFIFPWLQRPPAVKTLSDRIASSRLAG